MKYLCLLDDASWVYGMQPITDDEIADLAARMARIEHLGLPVQQPVVTVDLTSPEGQLGYLGRVYDAKAHTFSAPCPRPTRTAP